MKIWEIVIGTEELGGDVECVCGLAETADEAISKAMAFAKSERGHRNAYPSKVTEIGEQIF